MSFTGWIVSREDLILSKLLWARDSESELQLRDVKSLLEDTSDQEYLKSWAADVFDRARAIVESSLPAGLSRRDRRMALISRLHGNELPKAALEAFAGWQGANE